MQLVELYECLCHVFKYIFNYTLVMMKLQYSALKHEILNVILNRTPVKITIRYFIYQLN